LKDIASKYTGETKNIKTERVLSLGNEEYLNRIYESEVIYNLFLEKIKIERKAGYDNDLVINKEIDSGWNPYSKKLILTQKSEEYTEYVRQKFDLYESDYKRGVINIDVVFDVCSYVGSIQCGNSDPIYNEYTLLISENFNKGKEPWNMMYPFLNDTGIFAINTFMYAFFNRILLVGIPNRDVRADYVLHCPYQFLYHDFNHVEFLKQNDNLQAIENNRDLYYELVNRKFLPMNPTRKATLQEKELMMLMFWWYIHESNSSNLDYFRKIGRLSLENYIKEYNKASTYENLEVRWSEYYEVLKDIRDKYIELYGKRNFEQKFKIIVPIFDSYEDMVFYGGDDIVSYDIDGNLIQTKVGGAMMHLACSAMASWYLFYNFYFFDSL
jgi:hypothetical protein